MAEVETGFKWWMRYVIVPVIGGGGLYALIVSFREHPVVEKPPVEHVQSHSVTQNQPASPTLNPDNAAPSPDTQSQPQQVVRTARLHPNSPAPFYVTDASGKILALGLETTDPLAPSYSPPTIRVRKGSTIALHWHLGSIEGILNYCDDEMRTMQVSGSGSKEIVLNMQQCEMSVNRGRKTLSVDVELTPYVAAADQDCASDKKASVPRRDTTTKTAYLNCQKRMIMSSSSISKHAGPAPASDQPTIPEPSFAERARTLMHMARIGSLSTLSRKQPGFPACPVGIRSGEECA